MGRGELDRLPRRGRARRVRRRPAGPGDSFPASPPVSQGPLERDGRPALVLARPDARPTPRLGAAGEGQGGEGETGRRGDRETIPLPPTAKSPPLPLSLSPPLVSPPPLPLCSSDPAAIIFTTGSTGPPKGVLFTHGNFDAQVDQIRDRYGNPARRNRSALLSVVRPVNCRHGRHRGNSRHGPFAAGAGRSGQGDRGRSRLKRRPRRLDRRPFGTASAATARRVEPSCPPSAACSSAGAPIPAEVLRLVKACIHAEGNVPYALRRYRGLAGGHDFGDRGAGTERLWCRRPACPGEERRPACPGERRRDACATSGTAEQTRRARASASAGGFRASSGR